MDKIPFEDGVKTQEAYVTVNEQNYPVTPAVWTGTTPLKAFNLNKMQDNIEEAINGVVESGSNANGSWVKFSDGTMMQWGSKSFVGAETGNTGSYAIVTFPQAFADNKFSVSYSPLYSPNYANEITLFTVLTGSHVYGIGSNSTQDTVYRRLSHTTDTTELSKLYATNLSFNWQAIGKWK